MQRLPRFLVLIALVASISFMAFFSQGASAQEDATPTPEPTEESAYAFDWGMGLPTQDQIDEALACDAGALAIERFEGMDLNDPATSYMAPETACDWAAVALAYTNMLADENTPLSDGARTAFVEMMRLNPALAFQADVFTAYMHRMTNLVATPAEAEAELAEVHVVYTWIGLGIPSSFDLTFTHNEDGTWTVTGTRAEGTGKGEAGTPEAIEPVTLDGTLFEAWGAALSDFLPVQNTLMIVNCTDNYPQWDATLTFADGSEAVLSTNGSTNLGFSGIWQSEMDGQLYAQYSPRFFEWLNSILTEVGMGQDLSNGYYCMGGNSMSGNLINDAYASPLAPTATP